ncbi:TadE/TadG family type IV pilus assembly protein [Rhizorhapis sp. SPR117]|uniref:TadE/TadG family type IV pilus assembly protein n=1 Tax=Rhizorhapis sp. SPR117 TaxID=2912611 RepID=UPI001F214173|nr:pilus assembly protein [Rhizorhapis sp. SPR117]
MTAAIVPAWARRFTTSLGACRSGVAMVEFALCLPFVVTFAMSGVELTNFTTTKMRMSQIALHVADNASRIGTGTLLSSKQISEAQINDLLTGAGLQAGQLDLYTNGRVILTSLEPVANPNTTSEFKIRWQRCRGAKNWPSSYGDQGDTDLDGITANGQLITAPDDGAVMFVEVSYTYQPLVTSVFVPKTEIVEIGAMTVRDARDMAGPTGGVGIYNAENVTASTCA